MTTTPASTQQTLIAGSMSGMSSVLACHPFDTVRTRLQASPGRFPTFRHCVRWTIQQEGWRGFYKGFGPPFLSQAVYKSVIFMVSNTIRQHCSDLGYSASWVTWTSGAVAGALNGIIVSPVELVRNQLQVQYDKKKRSTLRLIQYIWKEHGLRGMFRGLPITMLRDGIGVAFYFAGFEASRSLVGETAKDASLTLLVSGASGGLSFWIVALPFDTLKTCIQVDHHSRPIQYYVSNILNEYGWKGFFHGWQVAFSRGIPSAAITFWSYHRTMDYLQG